MTTSLSVNQSSEGETIENKIERIVNNKEPITDGAPIIYTERKQGVVAGYDIRTDRWEIAIDAMSAVDKANKAKREESQKKREEMKVVKQQEDDAKSKSAGGTGE